MAEVGWHSLCRDWDEDGHNATGEEGVVNNVT